MPSGSITTSERGRELAQARHAAATPEQRRENTRAASQSRVSAKDVDAKLEPLGATMLDRFDAVLAELAELRAAHGDRIAA